MSIHFASFGGILKIGDREAVVEGLTYRMICERSGWWLSEVMCPSTELRRLVIKYPQLQDEKFCEEWLKIGRKILFLQKDALHAVRRSVYGRIFDVWQATRNSGVSIEDIQKHLDDLTGEQARNFFAEAYKKITIANGTAEVCYLNHSMRQQVAPGKGIELDLFFTKLCWEAETRFPINELLDCTPAMIKRLTTSTKSMAFAFEDDCAVEAFSVEKQDAYQAKQYAKKYAMMAKNILEGRRIDNDPPREKRVYEQMPSAETGKVASDKMPLTAGGYASRQ